MDKKGNIGRHSKEKLLVYKQYLVNYLYVLTNPNQRFYEKIFIWDIFAGKGKDEKGNKGSALIAAEVIKDFREKKEILLFLNELKHFEILKENLKDYSNFARVCKEKAENFLKKVIDFIEETKQNKFLNFFFIDPHGYTEYSTETLKKLLNLKKSEYLIFIPTNHIYRFAKALSEGNPAAKFVRDLGIENKDFDNANNFVKELENKFKELAQSDFVYSYKIENKEAPNSFHHLFFITKHIRGAEKFLQTKNKIKEALPHLFENLDKENAIKEYIQDWRSNHEIYEWGIKNALLPKEINPILRALEKENILVVQCDNPKRRKGFFYLNEKPKERLQIKLK